MEEEVKKKQKKQPKKREITVKANKKGRHIMPFMNVLRVIVLPIYRLLKPCRFYGDKKVKDGACVYVSNHRVMFDIAYPAMTTWEGLHYIPKKSLTEVPIVRGLIKIFKAWSLLASFIGSLLSRVKISSSRSAREISSISSI